MKVIPLVLTLLINSYFGHAFASPATVVKYQGKVLINKKIISRGIIPLGAEIDTTEKNSRLIIRTADGKILRFSEGIAKYEGPSLIDLLKGKLFAFIRDVPNKGKEFQVRTRTAAMGVRGTKFLVLEDEKESYLCVCEGVVEAKKKSEPNKPVDVAAGFDLSIQESKPLGSPTKASEIMWDIATKGFKEMGVPIEVPESE